MSRALACIGPDEEPRLRDEHSFQERNLSDAIERAQAGDWVDFEVKWAIFRRAFDEHVRYEENLLFPAYAQSENAAKIDVGRLRAEHASIASEIKFLDGESQQPGLFIEQLRHLLDSMRAHHQREEKVIYPWLAQLSLQEEARWSCLDDGLAAGPQEDSPWDNPARSRHAAERMLR